MKTVIDSAEYSNALFREFGFQPDIHPVVLQIENILIRHILHHAVNPRVLMITPSICVLHIRFVRSSRDHEVIVTFSESETEVIRHNLLVVALPVQLAA